MDLKEARYIVSIANHQSISKGAEELFISQPSLSKYLKNMEDQLGCPLFERINNRYIPTYIGERYLHYARKILDLRNEWNSEFEDLMEWQTGRINISTPIMLSNILLHPALPNFFQLYPNVKLNLLEDVHFVAETTLNDPSIDLTLYTVYEPPKQLDYEIIRNDETVLLLPPNHPLREMAIMRDDFQYPWIDLTFCAHEKFILLSSNQNSGIFARKLFNEYNINPIVLMETRNSELSIRLALEGTALTFAPASYIRYFSQKDQLNTFSVGKQRLPSILIAAFRKNRYQAQYVKDFIKVIQDYNNPINIQ